MTVEAHNINLFSSSSFLPLCNSKKMLNTTTDANMYGNPATESVFPYCNSQRFSKTTDSHVVNPPLKDETFLTFNDDDLVDIPTPRKRPREETALTSTTLNNSSDLIYVPNNFAGKSSGRCGTSSSGGGGENLSVQMIQEQFEMDRLIFLHMEKVKIDMDEQRRKQSNRTIRAIEEAVSLKLRGKDEEIDKMSKLNVALQERVRSLYLENQLWRDLAQSNEAAANVLRSNLDQLLAQVNNNNNNNKVDSGRGDDFDAESCCGSSGHVAEDENDGVEGGGQNLRWRTVAGSRAEKRMCRWCGGMESSVLVLPCRHLCLCTACVPTVHTCPICKSTKNASIHVNFS